MKKRIIIVGGGFAGLQLAENIDTKYYDVFLLDSSNHHQFQPLFYQVAAAQIEPSSISFPFRKVFQDNKGVHIRMTEVRSINPELKQINTDIGSFDYDYLVIATGCKTNYFNNKVLERDTYPLKSTRDAIKIRNTIIRNFEKIVSDPKAADSLYNIVIVGAGPTGVELSGAFAEMKKNIIPKDYPEIDINKVRIILIEGSGKTLGSMSELSQKASLNYLNKLGVEVILNAFVKDYEDKNLTLSNGQIIPTSNVIWAAGVKGNIIEGIENDVIVNNRYLVNDFNEIKNHKGIYAIGDIALLINKNYPKGHPQVANVAINQAKNLAKNFSRIIKNKELRAFEYIDKGAMATVGKYKATVDLPFISFKGFFAWLVWMFLHLMLILSVRNKLIIFINWVWSFFTNDTSLRLIFNKTEQKSIKNNLLEHKPST